MVLVFWDGFFHMGAADCWLFRLQRLGGSLAIFHFDDLFPRKASDGVDAPRCQKQYGIHSGSGGPALAMSVVYTLSKIGFLGSMMWSLRRDILIYSAL